MDQTTFRILETLSRHIGSPISILQLTGKIRESHGTAHYSNIYHKLHALAREGILTLKKSGRSWIAGLNFSNYMLLDTLTEMELRKKREFLEKASAFRIFLPDLEERSSDIPSLESICLINARKNMKLNRAELLILLHDFKSSNLSNETVFIQRTMQELQSTHNIRIDSLPLTASEFTHLLGSEEINPVKEMIANKIAFYSPQGFWKEIARAIREGLGIRSENQERNPAKITENDTVYNLARFGYRELGTEIKRGQEIRIEQIITSLLMQEDARRIAAIPIILAKNKANYNLLTFLSRKYGFSDKLLWLLKALNKVKRTKETAMAIETLQALNTREIRADEGSIVQKIRLYNVPRQARLT